MTQSNGEPPTMPLAVPQDVGLPPPTPGTAQPVPVAPAVPVLVRVGDITVTPGAIHTPVGVFPLHGSAWQVTDHWVADRYTPTWAIVLSIVLSCPTAFLSLLLLLVRDTRFHGMVAITVTSGAYQYTCHVPVASQPQIAMLHQQASHARSLAAIS